MSGLISNFIFEKFQLISIAPGEIVREFLKKDCTLALRLRKIMESGNIVPAHMITEIIYQRLKQNDCSNGFLLCNFPTNQKQASLLDTLLGQDEISIDMVIEISPWQEFTINYIWEQINYKKSDICGSEDFEIDAPDEEKDKILEKLTMYDNNKTTVIDYYQNEEKLERIMGNNSINEIISQVLNLLEVKFCKT